MSARFRPRTMTDSPALHPLHSAAASASQITRNAIAAFRRPQTGETVRRQIVRARNAKWPRDRPASSNSPRASHGQDTAIRREAPPVAEDKAIAPRGFARCKTPALTVSTAIFRPLHFAGAPFRRSERWPTSLIKPNWSDTAPSGCVPVCRARPCTHRVAARALHSAVAESELLASRWRDCAN